MYFQIIILTWQYSRGVCNVLAGHHTNVAVSLYINSIDSINEQSMVSGCTERVTARVFSSVVLVGWFLCLSSGIRERLDRTEVLKQQQNLQGLWLEVGPLDAGDV